MGGTFSVAAMVTREKRATFWAHSVSFSGIAGAPSSSLSQMSRPPVVDRPMPKGKAEVKQTHGARARARDGRRAPPLPTPAPSPPFQVSLAAFAFLFSELVQYNQARVSNIGELERR